MKASLEIIKNAMHNARRDDYARAKSAFRHFSPERMKLPYGDSGKSPQEILDDYEESANSWTLAWEFLLTRIPELRDR